MDCARTAHRLGARTVQWNLKVLYRRSAEAMRVTPGELDELAMEGIPLECHAAPERYLEQAGRVAGMRFRHAETGRTFDVPADTILLATGQSPDFSWAQGDGDLTQGGYGQKLFAAGDFAQGSTSLIEAIAHARQTAENVDYFLMGEVRMKSVMRVENVKTTGRTPDMDAIERQPMPSRPLPDRDLPSEVELGYDAESALREARRCYRCDYKFEIDQDKCIKCDWCLKAKPRPECILMLKEIRHDEAGRIVAWETAESVREMNLVWINSDACIRCGACIKACPVDAISLQRITLSRETALPCNDIEPEEQP